jgi:spore germination cell wall hydrolase CwlJ-like protein
MKLGTLLWLASLLGGHAHQQACVAATVYLEARDQSELGQFAVAEVIMRRRASRQAGADACAVVKQRYQFALSATSNNYEFDNPKALQRAVRIAGDAMAIWQKPARARRTVVPGADHFYLSSTEAPAWAVGEPVAVIGGHSFYRVGL